MPTHKVLRAVAHNIGHSFLSLGPDFIENSWPVQHLLTAARDARQPAVVINLIAGTLSPPTVASEPLSMALAHLGARFSDMVKRSGASMDLVQSAELSVNFRFDEKRPGQPPGQWFAAGVIVPEMVPYSAVVTIVDDRGAVHESSVKEWWYN